MFGLGKNNMMAKANEFKATMKNCSETSDKVISILEESNNFSEEDKNKAKKVLESFESLKQNVMEIKNNASLRPRDKMERLSGYEGDINRLKIELNNTVKILEEYNATA